MAGVRTAAILTAVRLADAKPNGGFRRPLAASHLSVSKPSWIVRTESYVRRENRKRPDPPCVVCQGTGRVDCHHCNGRGRTNYIHLPMLPGGEWPKWCRTCGGSGLSYCSRCLGTGEFRYIMGFRFMDREVDLTRDNKHPTQADHRSPSGAERLLNQGQSDPTSEI